MGVVTTATAALSVDGGRMDPMAIKALTGIGHIAVPVLDLNAVARLAGDGRYLIVVYVVAARAGLFRVHHHGRQLGLSLVMASQTVRRLLVRVRSKAVASYTFRNGASIIERLRVRRLVSAFVYRDECMLDLSLLLVTVNTCRGAWTVEALLGFLVAGVAIEAEPGHVRLVPWAKAVDCPGCLHERGG